MSYLDRLKDRFPENCPTEVLTKPTEAPFVSSVSTRVGQNKTSDSLSQQDSDPAAFWWRVAILEPGGRTVEVDTPSGWTLTDWQAYAGRYHGPGCAVMSIAGLPKPEAPADLDEALCAACEDVAGITTAQFHSLLSLEDLDDIAAGAIHRKTLRAYALSFAEGIRSGRVVVLPGRAP